MLIKRIIAYRPIHNFRFSSLRIVTSENPIETVKSLAQTVENLAKDVNDLKNNLRSQIQNAISSELSGKNHESNSNGKQSEKSSFWQNLLKFTPVATFIWINFSIFVWTRLNGIDENIKDIRKELKKDLEKMEKNQSENLNKVVAKIDKSLEKNESNITELQKSINQLDKNFVYLETKFNLLEMKIDNQGSSMNSIALCILGIATASVCGMEVYKSFFK